MRIRGVVLVAALVLQLPHVGGAEGEPLRRAVFGSIEFRAEPLTPDRQWPPAARRMAAQREAFRRCRDDARQCPGAALKSWRRLVDRVRGAPARRVLDLVNRYVNSRPYRADGAGIADRWAAPGEFLAGAGDCEDYAIAKLLALRLLGFAGRDLRVVAVHDTWRDADHAVLAVPLGGDVLILDNATSRVLSHRRLGHYVPRYSVNEGGRWVHIPAARLPGGVRPARRERLSGRV